MAEVLLFESRDPFESRSVDHQFQLARELAARGNRVTIFLVQNGALAARAAAGVEALDDLAQAGVVILADAFALRERGIAEDELAASVRSAPLDVALDLLASGARAIFH